MVQKVMFKSHIFDTEFLMELYVFRCYQSESDIFSGSSFCVCMHMCMWMRESPLSTQFKNSSRQFKFGFLYMHHMEMLPRNFYNKSAKQSVQRHKFQSILFFTVYFILFYFILFLLLLSRSGWETPSTSSFPETVLFLFYFQLNFLVFVWRRCPLWTLCHKKQTN